MQVDAWPYRQGPYVTTAKSILKYVDELAFGIRNVQQGKHYLARQ
jgi:hypothetical protein